MCGIMGYVGGGNAVPVILDGLNKLEYRGYDSAGIAVYSGGNLDVTKKKGRLADMISSRLDFPNGKLGIGHTRWATHGEPSDQNAHPHCDCSGRISLVHNGIIENYASLRRQLLEEGHSFLSSTDTEVVVHLVEKFYKGDLAAAVSEALAHIRGSYALAVISVDEPDRIIAAKKDSPLIVGIGQGENYVASDIPAILGITKQVYILQEHEMAVITADSIIITDFAGNRVERDIFEVTWDAVAAEKGGFEHFMLKEIYEQPEAVRKTIAGRIQDNKIALESFLSPDVVKSIEKIFIVACGTAYHAGLVGKSVIEKLSRITVETDIASEFRYRDIIWQPGQLMIVISQSGETADTLAALREAKRNGVRVLAITNVVGSSMAREADGVLYTYAGPEIAVASTKAYTTQLVVMYLLGLYMAQIRQTITETESLALIKGLLGLDQVLEQTLRLHDGIKKLAYRYQTVQSTFFLGRGLDYAVAMEGALKLKEISYIHAEAYAAGELKHGPLALIHDGVPVLALITQDHLLEKTMSNIKEVKARGAVVIAICKENLSAEVKECDEQIVLPEVNQILAPMIAVAPLQIFAYYMAVYRGADVDKPRNLAKSVTVE